MRHAFACRWLWLPTASANGNRIDDRLDPTRHPGLTEHEQELPCFVVDELLRVHVLQDIDAVPRQQDLMDLEDT